MDKKIVVLIRAGLPFKNTIIYGRQRARETGSKLLLVGVIPDMGLSRKLAFATYEIGPYENIAGRMKQETSEYLERAVQFCLDNGATVETATESGGLEGVVKRYAKDPGVRLVIVPSPTRREHHSEFLDTIRHFTQEIIDYNICCPVVSVLAT